MRIAGLHPRSEQRRGRSSPVFVFAKLFESAGPHGWNQWCRGQERRGARSSANCVRGSNGRATVPRPVPPAKPYNSSEKREIRESQASREPRLQRRTRPPRAQVSAVLVKKCPRPPRLLRRSVARARSSRCSAPDSFGAVGCHPAPGVKAFLCAAPSAAANRPAELPAGCLRLGHRTTSRREVWPRAAGKDPPMIPTVTFGASSVILKLVGIEATDKTRSNAWATSCILEHKPSEGNWCAKLGQPARKCGILGGCCVPRLATELPRRVRTGCARCSRGALATSRR